MHDKLTAQQLINRCFRFERNGGPVIAPLLILDDGGKILKYSHPNEASWDVQDGYLLFKRADGVVTSRFNNILASTPLELLGTFLAGEEGIQHRLVEVFPGRSAHLDAESLPCLCVIFNHNYERNLPILREIYRKRFSKVLFLMPFYQGEDVDVIPYYEGSHYFQASVTQGLQRLLSAVAPHYIFVADDLILNPTINENNVIERLGGRVNVALPLVQNISVENGRPWERRLDIARISANSNGCEWKSFLPAPEWVIERMNRLGLNHRVDATHFRQILQNLRQPVPSLGDVIIDPEYPCLAGYSDIFIVPTERLRAFAHYAGVTSAMKLFVEVAIPTISLLVSEKLDFIEIAQRIQMDGAADSEFVNRGLCLWQNAVNEFGRLCNYDMANAFQGAFSDTLFIHPLKLSKWH
jgi:hypothetical protein